MRDGVAHVILELDMNGYGGLLVDQEMSRLRIALGPAWGGFAAFDERLARKWDGGLGHGSGFLFPEDAGQVIHTPWVTPAALRHTF